MSGEARMKTVILAGGMGTRLTEETQSKPKPMVEIGGQPILWHIMKHFAGHGFNEFVIALGYRGEAIKRYFVEYPLVRGNVSIDLASGEVSRHDSGLENWRVHLIDTGLHTITGGRVKRLRPWVGRETFLLTYGDGVSNVDLTRLVDFHRRHGKLATVTAVRPPARFGGLTLDGDCVQQFTEKPQIGEGWINGGFFVLEPEVLDLIAGDETHLELEPMEQLVAAGELMAYKHDGFWQCMDTIREHRLLENLWASGAAPWKTWDGGLATLKFASAA
jgi:glucose-1-phosphate cytidylyltransferase